MAGYLDGIGGLLSDIFGAPVSISAPGGQPVQITAVFRETPVQIETADGRVEVISVPTLRLPASSVAIAARWTVAPSICAPRSFAVLRVIPSTSAAADGLLTCELEETR